MKYVWSMWNMHENECELYSRLTIKPPEQRGSQLIGGKCAAALITIYPSS